MFHQALSRAGAKNKKTENHEFLLDKKLLFQCLDYIYTLTLVINGLLIQFGIGPYYPYYK